MKYFKHDYQHAVQLAEELVTQNPDSIAAGLLLKLAETGLKMKEKVMREEEGL
jgi:hypothetical protein